MRVTGTACLLLGLAASAGNALSQSRSAVTDPVDRFVLLVLDEAQALSVRDNVEYCGVIGYDAQDKLSFTGPFKGERDSCDPGGDPAGFQTFASYHTHGGYTEDADTEAPSVGDLVADFSEGIDGYVATPSGRVWFNSLDYEVTYQLCGRGCLVADPKFKPCAAFLPANEYTLEGLIEREENDPGYC